MKPLYGIPEAGTHWFGTYHSHHTGKLQMTMSTYNPCLLITTTDKEAFGIVGMQTDNTLILGTEQFSATEDIELEKANFQAKPKSRLTADLPIIFNRGVATLNGSEILLKQKNQADKLQQIDLIDQNYRQSYMEQRARGAYIATVCQPEASFDLSIAAQHQEPEPEDIKALNKRLKW